MSEAGVRVVAIDNRGRYGTGSASPQPSYARDDLARDLVAVVEALGTGPVHLMGHSYGGPLARAAVLATQGDPALWASVTFMNFGPAGVSAVQQERLHSLLSVVGSTALAGMRPFVKNKEVAALPDVAEFVERRWLSNSPQQLAAAAQRMLSEADETSRLAVPSVPKFVISGTPDETWPPEGVERMARGLGARFVRSDGGGHSPNLHRPAETASALLGFWRSRRGTAAGGLHAEGPAGVGDSGGPRRCGPAAHLP